MGFLFDDVKVLFNWLADYGHIILIVAGALFWLFLAWRAPAWFFPTYRIRDQLMRSRTWGTIVGTLVIKIRRAVGRTLAFLPVINTGVLLMEQSLRHSVFRTLFVLGFYMLTARLLVVAIFQHIPWEDHFVPWIKNLLNLHETLKTNDLVLITSIVDFLIVYLAARLFFVWFCNCTFSGITDKRYEELGWWGIPWRLVPKNTPFWRGIYNAISAGLGGLVCFLTWWYRWDQVLITTIIPVEHETSERISNGMARLMAIFLSWAVLIVVLWLLCHAMSFSAWLVRTLITMRRAPQQNIYNSIGEAIEAHVCGGPFRTRGVFRWAAYFYHSDQDNEFPYAPGELRADASVPAGEVEDIARPLHRELAVIDNTLHLTNQGENVRVVVVFEDATVAPDEFASESPATERRIHFYRYGSSGFAIALADEGDEGDRKRLFNGIGRLIDTRISLSKWHYSRWTWKNPWVRLLGGLGQWLGVHTWW